MILNSSFSPNTSSVEGYKTKESPPKYDTVTGGEPLAPLTCPLFLTRLRDIGYDVSLETSGAIDVSDVDKRVKKIIDIKTPGSNEHEKNKFENLKFLSLIHI